MASCVQCGEPGDDRTLLSWPFASAARYLCRNAVACIVRQRAQQAEEESRHARKRAEDS